MLLEYEANSHLAKSEGGVFCITQSSMKNDALLKLSTFFLIFTLHAH
jgi:hypothetical protein